MTQTQPSRRPPSPWFGLRYGRGLSPRIRLMSRCLSNWSLTRATVGGRRAGKRKPNKGIVALDSDYSVYQVEIMPEQNI